MLLTPVDLLVVPILRLPISPQVGPTSDYETLPDPRLTGRTTNSDSIRNPLFAIEHKHTSGTAFTALVLFGDARVALPHSRLGSHYFYFEAYRQMYANTGIATDSARRNHA